MSYFLQPDVHIAVPQGEPVLFRDRVPVNHRLRIGEALGLTFLGATGDPETAESFLSECLPDRSGYVWIQRILDRYWTYLGEGPRRPIDLAWLEAIDLTQLPVKRHSRREAAPSALIWLVTLACNRRCPYCFYTVSSHSVTQPHPPADASFPLVKAAAMVQEMGKIGAADLFLTGGEPLLRRDLPELIETASAVRVRTHLVTKYPLTPSLARRLASAGLTGLTVSLDDARPKAAAALTGSIGYLKEAEATIRAALNAGLGLEVNAVVTRVNADYLEQLVEYCIELGVPKLTFSPYAPPHPARPAAIQLLPTKPINFLQEIDRLRQHYGQCLELSASSSSAGNSWEPCADQAVCDVGFRELHVLPDGRATRCRYLPEHEGIVVGSLLNNSILEIWNGTWLGRFTNPSSEEYGGSGCRGCGSFEACNSRGRCYFTALTRSGRLYAPDDFCTKDPVV